MTMKMKKEFLCDGFYSGKKFLHSSVCVENGCIVAPSGIQGDSVRSFTFDNCIILPGFVDVHVHLRQPGFCYKETVATGTAAAAHGGYSAVCSMANLNPTPDSVENITVQCDIIDRDAKIKVYPYATITEGEKGEKLVDFSALSPYCIGFSDDGKGVQSEDMMRAAMTEAKALDKIIVAHCEDEALLGGRHIHDGYMAEKLGISGISSESEWKQIERDLRLAKEIGCKYHVCHISTKESVDIIRKAKAEGVDVTCETGPHYLVFDDTMLLDEGRFKMNPPIRSAEDRAALIEGICDGTIDMIATDHAPHSAEEKSKGLLGSLMGVVGLETAFSVMYTCFVKTGIITMERLLELMCYNPRARFGIGGGTEVGDAADFTVIDLNEEYSVDPEEFLSMGRATPFAGMKLWGKVKCTVVDGEIIWSENQFNI